MAIIANTDLKAQQAPVLWYDSPAEYWEEALPLGNGRLGAMVYGNPVNEEIQLNEETISPVLLTRTTIRKLKPSV
ncbi:MAG: glycoside hydrolase N-terminal domain-containing protein [Bacteroides cellulosilyticus]